MNDSATDLDGPVNFKSVLPFVGLLVVLGVLVPFFSVPSTGLPSFGSSVSVYNSEDELVSVRVQSALADETQLILPAESGHYKQFAGDHGDEFTRLTQNPVHLTARYEDESQVKYEFSGQELYEDKHAAFTLKDYEFVSGAPRVEDLP